MGSERGRGSGGGGEMRVGNGSGGGSGMWLGNERGWVQEMVVMAGLVVFAVTLFVGHTRNSSIA